MARKTFSYTHGDNGTAPSGSLNFQANDRPNSEHFDWWWTNVISAINGHSDEFDRLDSNNDGVVDETDTVAAGGNLKGDLEAVDGEKVWDESITAVPQSSLQNDTITIDAGNAVSSAGSVSLGGSVTIDVDQDSLGLNMENNGGTVLSSATAADFTGYLSVTDDGDGTVTIDDSHNHDGRYARLYDGVQAPVYASLSDVPSGISKGELVFNDNDNTLYMEDGT